MKYKFILATILLSTSLIQALEFRVSKATFDWQMGMSFMDTDFDMDINVYSFNEQHNNFSDSKYYYFYNIDIYQSDFSDQLTTLITTPITHQNPFVGSVNDAISNHTPIPVPADYEVRGFELNLGVGYDLVNDDKGLLGIGINTGLSMPVMKMKNLQKSIEVTYDLLDATDTSTVTYKFGPIVHGRYNFTPALSVYGSFTMGLQTGNMENDWVISSLDIDGKYSDLDFGLRYTPWSSSKDFGGIQLDPKLYFTLGYRYKKWTMDDAVIDTFNISTFSSGGIFSNEFSTKYVYFGIGYDF